ncbi:hypothetical protein CRV02_13305 [Arcobacter sp. CECT 8989]|nr:hypothetical protein CRV02_13305 [Arcobacter sp. CECT 8989]
MPNTQTLEYNKGKGTISLCTYTEDGFLDSEINITDEAVNLVLDKLYDDYNLDEGDELLIVKDKSSSKTSKDSIKRLICNNNPRKN